MIHIISYIAIIVLLSIIIKKQIMSQEILDELIAKANTANEKADATMNSLSAIREDITDIKNSLPTVGGLSPDEVAALRTKLEETVSKNTGVAEAAAALDAENPEV